MSTLSEKSVLIVGDENSQIHNLETELKAHGLTLHTAACDVVTQEFIEEHSIDLLVLNHLHEGEVCIDMITSLASANFDTPLPIVALVEDSEKKIQSTLSLGAADYFTPEEDIQSIVQKIKILFGEGSDSSSASDIDITPTKAVISTSGIRVYIIEDDPLLRNLLAIRLEKSDFPHELSSDANGAIEPIHQFKPDVIILDLMLPGKSGLEFLAELKADKDLKDIPVIVFSNRDGSEDRHRARELGAAGFYVKAMTDLSELVETIEDLAR